MHTINLQNIGYVVRKKRGEHGIRETSKTIGISSATLSRIENGKLPDIDTFAKICRWLNVDANEILNCITPSKQENIKSELSIHLKADKNLTPEVAQAIANMIIRAQANF